MIVEIQRNVPIPPPIPLLEGENKNRWDKGPTTST